MFWYSTKDQKPSDSGQYLVYQGTSGFCFIADVDHTNDGQFYFHNSENDDYLTNITHFAQIPPIPRDNE